MIFFSISFTWSILETLHPFKEAGLAVLIEEALDDKDQDLYDWKPEAYSGVVRLSTWSIFETLRPFSITQNWMKRQGRQSSLFSWQQVRIFTLISNIIQYIDWTLDLNPNATGGWGRFVHLDMTFLTFSFIENKSNPILNCHCNYRFNFW